MTSCDPIYSHGTSAALLWPFVILANLILPQLNSLWPYPTSYDLMWPQQTSCDLSHPHVTSAALLWPQPSILLWSYPISYDPSWTLMTLPDLLSLWRRHKKSLPIFAKLPVACSSWYAEFRTFRIFKISLSVPKICTILFLFFKCVFIWKHILTNITVLIAIFMLNSYPLEFLRYLLPFKRYQWKHLLFLTVRDHSANPFKLIFDFYIFKMLWNGL